MVRRSRLLHLVERHLRHASGTHLVLGLVTRGSLGPELAAMTEAAGDDGMRTVILTRHDEPLRAALDAVPHAQVYDRRRAG